MPSLTDLGWSDWFAERFEPLKVPGRFPGRVAVAHPRLCRVLTAEGERDAELSGRLRHATPDPAERPTTGDWVVLSSPGEGEAPAIHARLPRRTLLERVAAGASSSRQVLAANVDVALVLTGLDGDFNTRRIERYVALVRHGGVEPVVVLTKADLCDDVPGRLRAVAGVAPGVRVLAIRALESGGVEPLRELLERGRTLALLGSSGVGKSTLVNRLLGEQRQLTSPVRERDSRGRHTTTRRELMPLAGGALLLDTPGLREVGLPAGGGSPAGFDDVEALAAGCAFRDCAHDMEPRCAVRLAAEEGRLDPARLESWRRLQAELRYADRRRDQRLRLEEQRRWKAIHKEARRFRKRR